MSNYKDVETKWVITLFCVTLLGLVAVLSVVITQSRTPTPLFTTWDSLEPDKWSSIWLIKRHIAPNAIIEVRPTGDPFIEGVTFGVPQAKYKRSSNQSTFESLLAGFDQQDRTLQRLGKIITAIETTAWNTANDPMVYLIEQQFRLLQDRYSRVNVPLGCYGHFFDVLYDQLLTNVDRKQLQQKLGQAINDQQCDSMPAMAQRKHANRVAELPIDQLLSEIAFNRQVIFVDTREPAEYSKSHIPGAINLPMRHLDQSDYDQLKQADLVISYCVKDFRGYEAARQMLNNGVANVAVMKPYGLSGWLASGLPLTTKQTSEKQALHQLMQCAKEPQLCKPA